MRHLILALALVLLVAGPSQAAEVNVSALGQNGWFSDDTRADGAGSQAAGTNLISPTLTDDPEATASGNPAHDADILNQILFAGSPPVMAPGGTHQAALWLRQDAGGPPGKSQISHRKDDATGFGAGTVFTDPGFFLDYYWMGNGTVSVTPSVKFGIRTSEFGSTGVSGRTGENVWDKVLIYEPGNLNGGTSDGTWHHEQVDYSTGTWWFFDRTAGAGTIGTPMTLSDMSTSGVIVSGAKTVADVYALITDPGAVITSVQVGIGSYNHGGSVYVNQLESSFYLAGDVLTFGTYVPPQYRVFGAGYAAGSNAEVSELEAMTGAGSWYKTLPVSPVVEMYIDPYSQLDGGFTIGEIAGIKYHTLNDGTNPSNVDFFLKIYTEPYTGGDASWYGNRLNSEPLYSNNYAPAANVWVPWNTDAGTNQLTFFDANHGPFGFYGAPTLADLKAGPIDWSAWDPGGDPVPIDYASQQVKYLTWGTGSGWASFTGYLDAIEILLTDGSSFIIDLEPKVDEVWVDDDWAAAIPGLEVEPGKYLGYNAFATVQDGVDYVGNSIVNVAAGTYEEQVEIDMDLELLGAGVGATIIQAPDNMPLFYTTSADNYPVIHVHDADNVIIRDLTVDGLGRGNTNYRFLGISYRQAGGGVYDCEIKDIRNTPLDGAQHGNGFYLYNNDTVARSMDVHGCDVYGFQKNGITLNSLDSTPLVIDVVGNSVTGAIGLTADNGDPAQNGIQVYGDLITGVVDGNDVHSIAYDNTNASTPWVATSILDYFTSATINGNVIDQAQTAVYKIASQGVVSNNDLSIEKVGLSGFGIIATDPPGAIPSPFEGPTDPPKTDSASKAVLGVLVDGNTVAFSGVDNTATYGIEADAGYYTADDLDLTVTNNTVTGFEVGVEIYQLTYTTGVFTNVVVNNNSFSGNTFGVRSNVDYLTVDATCNWWGDISGPYNPVDNIFATGDAVEGDVLWYPWLDEDITGTPACVMMPNMIGPNPSGDEITPCNPCVTVPVEITRTDATVIRGMSVTFELSSELDFCTDYSVDIVPTYGPGSWLGAIGPGDVQDFVLDNGDGTYTVDRSILGAACGSDLSGTVFEVSVTNTTPGDAIGTISVLSVTVRDCANAPVPSGPGPDGSVSIDIEAPSPIANLSAAQLKTGNDSDGTTKVQLAWDAVTDPDVTSIEIYRKGFGFYPEYDDGGGSVPATPTDPTDALANGWVLAASLPPGTTNHDDEPADRDFWYYIAFSDDGCLPGDGSNQTDGNLNYHLGDVSDGVTPGDGDNLVDGLDISALGAGYGTVDGDTNYKNWLDVGPTTDYSVDALPTTDDAVQFEDLMMFAINYGLVSKDRNTPKPASFNDITLRVVESETRVSVEVLMDGDGSLQGVHVPLRWNERVVRPAGMSQGDLMTRQDRPVFVASARAGEVDAAVLGTDAPGISGSGMLAVLHFEVIGDGDHGIAPGGIVARDAENLEQPITGSLESGTPAGRLPAASVLHPNYPNPFNPKTTISFTLAREGRVSLNIYSLDGRLVTTLLQEEMGVGPHQLQWTGLDDNGSGVSSGTYLVRLVTPDKVQSQRITLLK